MKPNCPACESVEVRRRTELVAFDYGVGSAKVELTCRHAVYKCLTCNTEFANHTADDARQAAIEGYLQNKEYWQTHQFCDHLQLADLLIAQSALRKHWGPQPQQTQVAKTKRLGSAATAALLAAAMLPSRW